MRKIAAAFLAATVLSMGPACSDTAGVDDPFFWTGGGNGAPSAERATPGTTAPGPAVMARPVTVPVVQPGPALDAPQGEMEVFPIPDGPADTTSGGEPEFFATDCFYPEQTPTTVDFSRETKLYPDGDRGVSPYDRRSGMMAGDDGVIDAMQDNPCTKIRRRGGETPESAFGYTNPNDIRRVNTLEDRRIPVHAVGRYAPDGSGLWYSDPANPFVDASQEWDVRRGELLSELLRRWGDDAGFTVVFQSPTDFVLQADVVIRGTFAEAAGQVVESFSTANPPIAADFFLGNKVLVVRTASDFDGR